MDGSELEFTSRENSALQSRLGDVVEVKDGLFWALVTPEQIRMLKGLYEVDFAMFGYDPDGFLENAARELENFLKVK